jgi:hypothetical protein
MWVCEKRGSNCVEPCSECEYYIEVEPVVHSQWNIIKYDKENESVFIECECGATFKLSMFDFGLCYNYCPNCGAKMEG